MASASIGKSISDGCFGEYKVRCVKNVKTLESQDGPSFVGTNPGLSERTLESREIDPWFIGTNPGKSGRTLFYRNSPEAEATLSARRNQRDDSIFRNYR